MALLWPTAESFAEPGITNTIISGLLGGLGAVIGFGVYSFAKTKKRAVKIITLIGLTLVCFTALIVIVNLSKLKLQTCEICGYKAIKPKDTECQFCGSTTWHVEKANSSYSTKAEWIKDEQLFWFRIDSLNENINFFTPDYEDGYEKDKNWKPTVTEQEIRADFHEK